MKLIFHGGAQEVGRSCIELITSESRILLDCGIKITPDGLEYPSRLDDLSDVDAVFLSHAHLDHSGALPLLKHKGFAGKIFCTLATAKLSDVLLKDSYKIDLIKHHHSEYNDFDIKYLRDNISIVSYNQKYKSNINIHIE